VKFVTEPSATGVAVAERLLVADGRQLSVKVAGMVNGGAGVRR
jgi:hypothetical protein